ncbi:MAG: class I SAM-dependent methyltransferase [Deltaproteobacteria bacterium]|nr:class I SAM-dependent methyltransferase [Deltaproteobacteria bacterium]
MFGTDPGEHWKRWGETDPYFGVFSGDEYRTGRLDDAARDRMFASGETHVEELFSAVRRHYDAQFSPGRALDFGCGVGRVALALARRSQSTVGVDISQGMLDEGARNAARYGVSNVEWVLGDDGLTRLSGAFDFVHSMLVFQHIRPANGYRIMQRMLSALSPGGVAALHVIYRLDQPRRVAAARWVQGHVPGANLLVNALKRRPLGTPNMEANVYALPRVFDLLFDAGCAEPVVRLLRPTPPGDSHLVVLARRARP